MIVDSRTGEVVEEGRNRVLSENDPTCERRVLRKGRASGVCLMEHMVQWAG